MYSYNIVLHGKPLVYYFYRQYYHSFSLCIGNTFIVNRKQDTDRQHFVVTIYNLFHYNTLHKNVDVLVVTFYLLTVHFSNNFCCEYGKKNFINTHTTLLMCVTVAFWYGEG